MGLPLSWFLIAAGLLFVVGLFGALARRNAIGMLMGIELMLNAANLNFVAFWRYTHPERMDGLVFAVTVIALAAAEAAVGLALLLAIYRTRQTLNVEEIDRLQL